MAFAVNESASGAEFARSVDLQGYAGVASEPLRE
jgi:hypothetical protein